MPRQTQGRFFESGQSEPYRDVHAHWPVDDLAALVELLAITEEHVRDTDAWPYWLRIAAYTAHRREQ